MNTPRLNTRLHLKTLITLTLALFISSVASSKVITVSGEATYYDDGSHSRNECMRLAAEQARIDALAKEFGTIVTQDIIQSDIITGNRERNDFLSLSATSVRGEWIADDGQPEYNISIDKEGNFIVVCKIKGKATAISNNSVDFETFVLRNAPERQAANNIFRNGDTMFLYFKGSVNGYVSAFLEDEQGNVYGILPYTTDTTDRTPVRKNREYIFFSPRREHHDQGVVVDELYLTANDHLEYNRVYVVYSPEGFSRPPMTISGAGFPVMDSRNFAQWLSKVRRNDPRLGIKAINIRISPNE